MPEKSILDQIISNHKSEEIANLDAVEIVANLFRELNEKERDILSRRFGLRGHSNETLENIGKIHNLTRERIRQIEHSGIKKIHRLKNLEDYVSRLKSVMSQLIEEHGGMIEREYLLNHLVYFSASYAKNSDQDKKKHKSHLDFLVSKLMKDEFESVSDSANFKNYFKFKHQQLDHLEEIAEELLEKIKELKKMLKTEELIKFAAKLDSFKKRQDQLSVPNNIDISQVLGGDFFDEDADLINNNKTIYAILQASKYIGQNKLGYWGASDWGEINPKTINDKVYLILFNHGKPMHFNKIADKINEIGFDKKIANAATAHNELIMDDKYVLVGRGLYALKEWGCKEGTVADVAVDILNRADEPMSRDEIIKEVLKRRFVKKATIILALMDRTKFEKAEGKYRLKI